MKSFKLIIVPLMASLLLAFLLSSYPSGALANETPPIFERARDIALTGKPSEINPACWFYEKRVAKNSMDFTFTIGFCKTDKSLVLVIEDGPMATALAFNGKEWAVLLMMFGQIVDILPISEEKAIEFAEKYFKELDSFGKQEEGVGK